MGNEVYANNREVSCKAAEGKSICAFPDVCMTPPTPPAGFLPIPYPNTGFASDTSNGSRTVKISGEEVMLKNKSFFKKSTGDEAATRGTPMGVLTATITGKVYFTSWSMDVKFEGENVVRMADLTTHNHMSMPGNSPPWPYIDQVSAAAGVDCDAYKRDEENKCSSAPPHPDGGLDCDSECRAAKACILTPKRADKAFCCNPDTTGDHLVEVNCFTQSGGRGGIRQQTSLNRTALSGLGLDTGVSVSRRQSLEGFSNYDPEEAPCVCVGPNHSEARHHALQAARDRAKRLAIQRHQGRPIWSWGPGENSFWTYNEAAAAGAMAHHEVFPQCNPACIKQQLDAYHTQQLGIAPDDELKTEIVLG